MKIAWPGYVAAARDCAEDAARGGQSDSGTVYLIGLAIFALTVVGYTLIGGFLAAVWTDLLQSVMMFIGVMILVVLALTTMRGLEPAARKAIENVEQAGARKGQDA